MTERQHGTVEPVPAAPPAAGAGSTSSSPVAASLLAPTRGRDAIRAALCALLAGLSVASPAGALLFAPFVPALVAIRVVRAPASATWFLALATGLSLLGAVLAAEGDPTYLAIGVASALLLVLGLGLVQVRGLAPDPVAAGVTASPVEPAAATAAWPEPRATTGFTLVLASWVAVLVAVTAMVLPAVTSVPAVERDLVHQGYEPYTKACAQDGALADQQDFCDGILEQRDSALELVDEHGHELLAAYLAIFAFGAAATSHTIALARARRGREAQARPAYPLRFVEVHWSCAYLVAGGLLGWLLAPSLAGDAATWLRAVAVGVGTLGGLLVVTQGTGLVAWLFARSSSPRWYRAVVAVGALLVLPFTCMFAFGLGVLDLALHPRRRFAASAGSRPAGDR